jgi:hypothetical protein
MKHEVLYDLLDRAFKKALEQLRDTETRAATVDLFLQANIENGVFSVLDDEDRELVSVQIPEWQEKFETLDEDAELKALEELLRDIVHKANDAALFDNLNILKPFSILLVDEEMETLSELLLIDDEQYKLDDHFIQKMDQDLDAFYKKLMSDL